MERRLNETWRAGATAVGVAFGLMALASTTQTRDGYIHASFGGPLDVFSTSSADVLAIGDGTNDASEIAAILKGPAGPVVTGGPPNSPYRVAYEAGAAPSPAAGSASEPPMNSPVITAAPTSKDAAVLAPVPPLPSKSVVDSQGRVDCSGAVSCRTDPATNTTTVTYPDGVVAIVQKINDLTVVAYKTLTEALPAEISSLLPPVPNSTPPLVAAAAPSEVPTPPSSQVSVPEPVTVPEPVVKPETTVTPPASETSSAPIDPGPPAPDLDLDLADDGPKVNVTKPSMDFSPGKDDTGTGISLPSPKVPSLGTVKDTIGNVVDAVKGAVGRALGPGASSKPESSTSSTSTGSRNSNSDNSGGDDSGGS